MILGCENIAPGIGLTGSWTDNCVIRSDGDQDNASFQGSNVYIDDNSNVGIGSGASLPCSRLELWDDSAHPILTITAAHATDYDPQFQFRTDVISTVKCSIGVDSGDSDKFKIYMGSGIGDTSQFVIDSSGNIIIGGSTAQTLMTISGTSAYLSLWNTSEEDTDEGCETRINFMGENSAGTRATYARIQGSHDGTGENNKGNLVFYTNPGTAGDFPIERMRISSAGNVSVGYVGGDALTLSVVERLYVYNNSDGSEWFSVGDSAGLVRYNRGGGRTEIANSGNLGARMNISTLNNGGIAGLAITGVASPTANLIEVNSIGDQSGDFFVIDKVGNTGIGVIDPDVKLELLGTSTQFKLSYDATNYATIATGANGDMTITTVDADGAAGHINFVPDGNVGFGVASPTSYVHIKAGTATAGTAPIKLTDGTLLGTPEAGTFEYAGNKFYITNVECQQVIERSGAAVMSTTTVSNTTDETTIYTHACPANSFRVGNHIHIECSGIISNDSASDDITINIYVGSDLISSYNPAIGNVTNANWHIILHTTIRTIGATGTIASHGHVEIDGNEDIANELDTIDTTASNNITVTVQWDNAKAGNTISLYQGIPHISN